MDNKVFKFKVKYPEPVEYACIGLIPKGQTSIRVERLYPAYGTAISLIPLVDFNRYLRNGKGTIKTRDLDRHLVRFERIKDSLPLSIKTNPDDLSRVLTVLTKKSTEKGSNLATRFIY